MSSAVRQMLVAAAVVATSAAGVATQGRAAGAEFAVASVKPDQDAPMFGFWILPGAAFRAQGVPVSNLLRHAFDRTLELAGIPDWARNEKFSIEARGDAADPGGSARVMEMLRSLLASRFALRWHLETREVAAYDLEVADVARLNASLHHSNMNCGDFVPGRAQVPEPNAGPRCAVMASNGPSGTRLTMPGRTLDQFALDLRGNVDRPIRNRTALDGRYDFSFEYVIRPAADATDLGVPLVTALREQLGLRLKAVRAPVQTVVVDHLERPSEN